MCVSKILDIKAQSREEGVISGVAVVKEGLRHCKLFLTCCVDACAFLSLVNANCAWPRILGGFTCTFRRSPSGVPAT